ncbi:hypothetical protein C4D60_Mb07t21850 [Musa balbisiana]|uniref:Uncharacterized protein n=1 Tax=Musa balbisiana TaxID=52838 RepID=A0A4S8JHB0_MUSBA|nr:hypothetical protein C4D60_Mb07t21850 [Musa balbisiana]
MDRFSELKTVPAHLPSVNHTLDLHGNSVKNEEGSSNAVKTSDLDATIPRKAWKGKSPFTEEELALEVNSFRRTDSYKDWGQSSFLGASHPMEPVDTDHMKAAYVAINQDKSEAGCLMRGLSVKGPFIEDISIQVPAVKSNEVLLSPKEISIEEQNEVGTESSLFSVPCASQSTETTCVGHDSEEKECVWDASLPPSGNVSPHSSIASTSVITAMSIVNSCTSTYRSEGITSDGMLSVERTCGSVKGSVRGDSLESAKSSVSRASDSSGLSDDSNWIAVLTLDSESVDGEHPKARDVGYV